MTDSYTEEELAALPSTSTVFDRPTLEFDNHDWVQQGYAVTDTCNPRTSACQEHSLSIPNGKLLVKENGHYDLVDEKR